MLRRCGRILANFLLVLCVGAAVAWSSLAIWVDGPQSRPLAALMAVGPPAFTLAAFALLRTRRAALAAAFIAVVTVALWWSSIAPSNDRDWSPEVARLARATIDGDRLTIRNVRNFTYRSETDFDQSWETQTYDLGRLRGLDLFISYWGPTLIAHTIASWDFGNGQHLAISIETRKQKGEAYSALRGFFRQYELYYVVAEERDLIGLRTNFRSEQVYLYHVVVPVAQARALLLEYLKDVNRLADEPRWYNALTGNCTTLIRHHIQNIAAGGRFDWRILANGYLDQLAYERHRIDTSIPFAELRKRSNITERAKAADSSPDFSSQIRIGLSELDAGAASSLP